MMMPGFSFSRISTSISSFGLSSAHSAGIAASAAVSFTFARGSVASSRALARLDEEADELLCFYSANCTLFLDNVRNTAVNDAIDSRRPIRVNDVRWCERRPVKAKPFCHASFTE